MESSSSVSLLVARFVFVDLFCHPLPLQHAAHSTRNTISQEKEDLKFESAIILNLILIRIGIGIHFDGDDRNSERKLFLKINSQDSRESRLM